MVCVLLWFYVIVLQLKTVSLGLLADNCGRPSHVYRVAISAIFIVTTELKTDFRGRVHEVGYENFYSNT